MGHEAAQALAPHPDVVGDDITRVEVASGDRPEHAQAYAPADWSSLSRARRERGPWLVRFRVGDHEAVELPVCSGRGRVWVDGREMPAPAGPVVLSLDPGPHELVMAVVVGDYEHRIACGGAPRAGNRRMTPEGLGLLELPTRHAAEGGGRAVVFVPPHHDLGNPGALLVGTHPWNGGIWTYAAYAELLHEAAAKDVVLLMPSGLGNSLYTAAAEEEVLDAIAALEQKVAIDPRRVSIWGASMGGAGATTIGFHHPDAFATVTSFFGDSKYDLASYVRSILHDESGAHLVNALDVIDNARHLPVWLVHGEEDKVSSIAQSEMLASALRDRGFGVRFDRVPHAGHEGAVVARFASALVDLASTARAPDAVPRVTYRGVRPGDTSAYGVRWSRAARRGDAFLDLERAPDGIHVHRADGVTRVWLARGAFGVAPADAPAILRDAGVTAEVGWDPLPLPAPPAPSQLPRDGAVL